VLSISADAIHSYKRCLGAEAQDVEFPLRADSAAGSWIDIALRLHRTLRWGETAAASPNVIRGMEERIVAGLVKAMVDPVPAREEATVARIRCAEDYLEANLKSAISLADIAHACDMPVRSLSRSFRSRYGVSPMRFAGEFRRHFGELPSATLARRPAQGTSRRRTRTGKP
jgi:transcriptional regulator GlxA family with amidase domain